MYSKPYAKGHHIKHLQEKKASGDQTQTTLSDLPVPMTVTSNSDHDRSLEMVYSSMGEKSGGGLGGRMAAQTASLGDQDIMTYMPSNSTNGISSPLHPESGAVGAPVGGGVRSAHRRRTPLFGRSRRALRCGLIGRPGLFGRRAVSGAPHHGGDGFSV